MPPSRVPGSLSPVVRTGRFELPLDGPSDRCLYRWATRANERSLKGLPLEFSSSQETVRDPTFTERRLPDSNRHDPEVLAAFKAVYRSHGSLQLSLAVPERVHRVLLTDAPVREYTRRSGVPLDR